MVKEKDVLEEVKFEIDEKSFEGPFTCECGKKTRKVMKKGIYNGMRFPYHVWKCAKCKKEYVDWNEPEPMEFFMGIQNIISGRAIKLDRALNYDGKAFFIRFPKDLTNNWDKEGSASIQIITPNKFLVEIKN